jgi:hypothetical protein
MFDLRRLRAGEWVLGASALVLLISSFLSWYGLRAGYGQTYASLGLGSGSSDAWSALSVVRWLILIVALIGLAAWFTQAGFRAPALSVSLTIVLTPLSLILALILINRVLISKPGESALISLRPGAAIGMVSSIMMFVGAYLSLREDGIRTADGPQQIQTFRQGPGPAGAR